MFAMDDTESAFVDAAGYASVRMTNLLIPA